MSTGNLNIHFNAPSVRRDTWGRLRNTVQRLQRVYEKSSDVEEIRTEIESILEVLTPMEAYMGYPGIEAFTEMVNMFHQRDYLRSAQLFADTTELLESGDYQAKMTTEAFGHAAPDAHYFELLVVKRSGMAQASQIRQQLLSWRSDYDMLAYNIVVVDSFEDALLATMLNSNLQACVIYDDIAVKSDQQLHALNGLKQSLATHHPNNKVPVPFTLSNYIRDLRPEICQFHMTEVPPERLVGAENAAFHRIFYSYESNSELHLSILKSVGERYETPFFDAVKKYSRQPVGTFHALPVSRGNSVFHSPWMKDFYEFYGPNMFLAESSATTGGMDSILQPTGTLKAAQVKAAQCFGSNSTFFVTNGTSTANKIIHQALTKPGDIVLLDRACHESHHFAFLLTGASPYYLESYSLNEYSIAGGVQLSTIKKALLELDRADLLDRVKMLVLTNCSFDGLTYNVQQYMEEVLAIKPDMVFLWDEAWFAFARFVPHYRQRTAMHSASVLEARYQSDTYREEYGKYRRSFLDQHKKPDDAWLDQPLLPDPDLVKIRVYAAQSTHKSLSCFRQGSMIHIRDELFNARAVDQFKKAYFTHTTTSPNYQILASLDVARRQVHMEGYALVQRQIEMALLIRKAINTHPLISRYFSALGPSELIPQAYRKSGVKSGFDSVADWEAVARAWEVDDFVLDPCRVNVYTARTGIDGFTLRTAYLAEKYNIQVNKTGMNSFCLMTNIGTTRSAVVYLIDCLIRIAEECAQRDKQFSKAQRDKFEQQRVRVTKLPPLAPFSGFHSRYLLDPNAPAGTMREAFFDAYDSDVVEYFKLDELGPALDSGRQLVGATFVVPVPPGYPMIAPGQVIDRATVTFLEALNVNEILGLDPTLGVTVFKEFHLEESAEKKSPARKLRSAI